jgi:ABC-type glycerol-3-phosphate transport system substrate-binding protein
VSKTADPEAAFAVLDFLMSPEERARYVAVSGTPTTVVSADVSAQRLAPAVRDYIDFIGKDATGYFGFYDQDIDYRRAQLLLDMSVALAQDPDMTRGEIEAMLGDIK